MRQNFKSTIYRIPLAKMRSIRKDFAGTGFGVNAMAEVQASHWKNQHAAVHSWDEDKKNIYEKTKDPQPVPFNHGDDVSSLDKSSCRR